MPKPVQGNGTDIQVLPEVAANIAAAAAGTLPLTVQNAEGQTASCTRKAVTIEVKPEPVVVLFTTRVGTAYPSLLSNSIT